MKCETNNCRRILIVDDMESIHDDYQKAINGGANDALLAEDEELIFGAKAPEVERPTFCIDSAYQGEQGCEMAAKALKEGSPYAVAFVDMRMPPGWDGVKTISKLWEIDPTLQVVICTAYADYSWSQIIEKLGISDKLLILKKPFDGAEVSQLALALSEKSTLAKQATMKMQDLAELVEKRDRELHHLALFDRLTGLANRYQLECQLGKLLNSEEENDGFGVIFLDFDRFKVINDSLGHKVGDQLLVAIADRLTNALREASQKHGVNDYLASRMGGDEFVVLLNGVEDRNVALSLSEDLAEAMRKPYWVQGREIVVTASFGVTTSEHQYSKAENVLRDADAAMYRAKSMGKDRCAVFGQEIHNQMMRRLQLETDLRHAVDRGELHVVYQPIICNEFGRILGFEALMRWTHPQEGPISPGLFIPIAEETGLIEHIGNLALTKATTQIAKWQKQFPRDKPLVMNVNVSKRQLLLPDCFNTIKNIIEQQDIEPNTIRLEVTESIIMDRPEHVAPLLTRLRALGIGIAMDDFGTGHSSLHCLNRFPIDVLKIDRAFVKDLESHRAYGAVIQAIVTLAENLNVHVVAEGVETEGQLAQLQALNCHSSQGWLFAPAESPEKCTAHLEQDREDGWAKKLIQNAEDIAGKLRVAS